MSSGMEPTFQQQVVGLFTAHFQRLYRYLNRLSGEPDLAADLAQEAFIRLSGRGSLPEAPEAWLVTVALNLFRNEMTTRSRRRRLLKLRAREGGAEAPAPGPDQAGVAGGNRGRVRAALDRLPERDRQLLLLQAEGYSYRDLALALGLNEASVGALLARARRAFRQSYGGPTDAP